MYSDTPAATAKNNWWMYLIAANVWKNTWFEECGRESSKFQHQPAVYEGFPGLPMFNPAAFQTVRLVDGHEWCGGCPGGGAKSHGWWILVGLYGLNMRITSKNNPYNGNPYYPTNNPFNLGDTSKMASWMWNKQCKPTDLVRAYFQTKPHWLICDQMIGSWLNPFGMA